ncbi:hypothetical protein V502_03502 [Pseudogymnoascus sp. VKM F-4520 (FW-2644)]|nr:hypothetical protein V502_03502 [Pseudogymnoascus sp. VKM F-4520 (FW-2644)]
MTDLSSILPAFSVEPYAHLLPSLERQGVSTTDLLALDPAALAKRANIPVAEVKHLCVDVLNALQRDLGLTDNGSKSSPSTLRDTGSELSKKWDAISTLDPSLDVLLSGGFPAGYITEVTGESGSGKTQLLLLLLLAVQLPPPHGLNRSAIYITTESSLPTSRLAQLRAAHPLLADTSLSRILTIHARDLETQDHILHFQLPLAIRRHNVGLVVIDSVAANFRAEFERSGDGGAAHGANMARRTAELVGLGALLRGVARSEGVAVVVSNQVADRFAPLSVGEGPRGSVGGWRVLGGGRDEDAEFGVGMDESAGVSGGGGKGKWEEVDEGSLFGVGTGRKGGSGDLGGGSEGSWGQRGRDTGDSGCSD